MSTPLIDLALGDLESELKSTRRLLERVPDDKLDWRPHEKSWSLGELATHIANLAAWMKVVYEEDFFDLGTVPQQAEALGSRAAMLERFDTLVEELQRSAESASSDSLAAPWSLRRGSHVKFSIPRVIAVRTVGISHMIHHRGQLTVYLRILNIPLPGIYGPSADEAAPFG